MFRRYGLVALVVCCSIRLGTAAPVNGLPDPCHTIAMARHGR